MRTTLSKQHLSYGKNPVSTSFFSIISDCGFAHPKQTTLTSETELQDTVTKPVPRFAGKVWNVSKKAVGPGVLSKELAKGDA